MPRSVGTITADFDARSAKFAAELEKVRKDVASLRTSADSITKSFSAVGTAMKAAFGIVTVGAVAGFARQVFEAADALGDAAARAGVSVESLSRLKFAAEQSDVEFSTLTTSIRFFQTTLSRAALGTEAASKAFESLALDAQQIRGLALEQQLARIADQFRKVQDPADRTRIAVELFGRAGQDLVPLLEQGSQGIEQLTRESDRLGVTMSASTAAGVAAADESLKKLKATLLGYSTRILGGFARGFVDIDDSVLRLRLTIEDLEAKRDRLLSGFGRAPTQVRETELQRINTELAELQARLEAINAIQRGEGGTRGPGSRRPLIQIREEERRPRGRTERDPFDPLQLTRETDDAVAEETRAARERDLEEFTEFARRKQEVEAEFENARRERIAQSEGVVTQLREQSASRFVSLLQVLGQKNKAFAALATAIETVRAVKSILLSSRMAAWAALQPPPIGLGPIKGAPLAAKLKAAGLVDATITGALGVAQIANTLSGDRGGIDNTGLGTPLQPLPVTPTDSLGAQQGPVTTIHFHGPVAGEDAFLELIRRAVNDRGAVVIRRTSQQAAEIRGG